MYIFACNLCRYGLETSYSAKQWWNQINSKVFYWYHNNAINKKIISVTVIELWQNLKILFKCNLDNILYKNDISHLEDVLFKKYVQNWKVRVQSQNVGNKLRT